MGALLQHKHAYRLAQQPLHLVLAALHTVTGVPSRLSNSPFVQQPLHLVLAAQACLSACAAALHLILAAMHTLAESAHCFDGQTAQQPLHLFLAVMLKVADMTSILSSRECVSVLLQVLTRWLTTHCAANIAPWFSCNALPVCVDKLLKQQRLMFAEQFANRSSICKQLCNQSCI